MLNQGYDVNNEDTEAVSAEDLWLCHTCRGYMKKGQVSQLQKRCCNRGSAWPFIKICLQLPPASIANHMRLDKCPPELEGLNYMEMQMISPVHTFHSFAVIFRGQSASKGIAISFPFDVAQHASVLPW